MKKQTAVEWLFAHLLPFLPFSDPKEREHFRRCLSEAKAMEKEQIVEAYSHGWHDGQDVILQQVKHIDKGGDAAGQKLYNETYGGDK